MINFEEIRKRINQTLIRNNITINDSCFEESCPLKDDSILAIYDKGKDSITFYINSIRVQFLQYNSRCSIEDFFEMVLCHELGHRDDINLSSSNIYRESLLRKFLPYHVAGLDIPDGLYDDVEEYIDISLRLEETAFKNGQSYISSNLREMYNQMNEHNIKSTEEKLINEYLLIQGNIY